MFESKNRPLLHRGKFALRILLSFAIGISVVLLALFVGMLGYHFFEGMSWIDAFANASMILSGMGPFGPLHTFSGKLFAGCYAIFSGLAFILIVGIILAPIIHRFFHKFHFDKNQ